MLYFGGVWEWFIRFVRKVLFFVLYEEIIYFDDEGFVMLFCEVEVIFNGRFLMFILDNLSDLSVLILNYLLFFKFGEILLFGIFL